MAVFYNLTRPNNPLTIENLEYVPKSRPKRQTQSRDVTPGGEVISLALGPTIQFITLSIKNLSTSDRDALIGFIEDDAEWLANAFDFDDDDGNQFTDCRFWQSEHDFKKAEQGIPLYTEELILRVDPT